MNDSIKKLQALQNQLPSLLSAIAVPYQKTLVLVMLCVGWLVGPMDGKLRKDYPILTNYGICSAPEPGLWQKFKLKRLYRNISRALNLRLR